MKFRIGAALVLAWMMTGTCFAQPKPDFSGTWVLDPASSHVGLPGSKAPESSKTVTLVLKQTPSLLTIERRAGNQAKTTTYKLEGSESVNKTSSGLDVKSKSRWVGATLVTDLVMAVQGKVSVASDVKSLSADGKILTVAVTNKSDRGDVKQTFIYRKQETPGGKSSKRR